MNNDWHKTLQLLEDLSKLLGIPFHVHDAQDWGLIHANPNRLREFIEFYNSNSHRLEFIQAYKLRELILSSANESLIEYEKFIDISPIELITFIKDNIHDFKDQLRYWLKNKDDEEMPIGKLLETIKM